MSGYTCISKPGKMISNILRIAVATGIACISLVQVRAQEFVAGSKGRIVFFDDFAGPSLDTTKWNVRVTGFTVNEEQQAYVNSPSTIYIAPGNKIEGAKNGALVIEAVFRAGHITPEGNKFDFISGRIDTRKKVEFTYGSVAARIKMVEGSGLWPAFWALGNGEWPDCGEIDIMEYVGEPDWTSVALHGPGYSGETPLVNKVFLEKKPDATQWHIYSVDWTKDGFLFKVDGKLVYRATRPMVEHYGRWAFDNPKYLILNLALGGAYPVKTNGVKKPYNGIPESTVQLIKNKQAKFMIDWVKVVHIP
jgi:beta-glucanase (GH16 family)